MVISNIRFICELMKSAAAIRCCTLSCKDIKVLCVGSYKQLIELLLVLGIYVEH